MTDLTASHRPARAGTGQRGVLRRLMRRIATGLGVLVTALVAIFSPILVILLFFVTAVPPVIAGVLAVLDIGIVMALVRFKHTPSLLIGALVGWVVIGGLAVGLSQVFASTPPITDTEGNVIPGSIATLERVELGGSQQWITIRGHSTDLPVLLFLAGGPGGSELVMTRRYLAALEEHFIVVNWDQPGTGKSYAAVDAAALTPARYISDAYALTQHLQERFGQEKIYVFGESWGSILGIWLVQQHPEAFHAFISTGQMVAVVENDIEMYEFALQRLTEQGRSDRAAALVENGQPPYPAGELIGKFSAMNGVVNSYMETHAHGEGTGHNLMLDSLGAQEYGLLDKVRWLLGLANTFTTVYPQIYDVDFRTQAPSLDVPVYMIKGRWDINASNPLTEEYFALLDAPHKALIWFEASAHTPSWDEPDHFVDVLVNTVLAETQQ